MPALKYVDPNSPPSLLTRVMARVGASPIANAISRRINWRLDPWLLRISGGRLATTLVVPTALLETRGARTGRLRRNAVIYFHDGPDRAVIVASQAGQPAHPGWFHNLRAHPDVTLGGVAARAAVVDDPTEQDRLWSLAVNVFPAFATYRQSAARVGRVIPLITLDLAPSPG